MLGQLVALVASVAGRSCHTPLIVVFVCNVTHWRPSHLMGIVPPERTYDEVFKRVDSLGTVFAIGNVGKGGLDIAKYFAAKKWAHNRTVAEAESNPSVASA